MNSSFILSQALISLAVCSDIASFQCKRRTAIFICFLLSSALISAHFFILGETTAGILYVLTFCRFLTGYFSRSSLFLVIFLALSIAASLLTYQSPVSLLALAGALFSTTAAFQQSDLRLRGFMFMGTSFWLIFNIVIWSPAAILRQVLFLVSNAVGLYRFYGKRSLLSSNGLAIVLGQSGNQKQ